MLERERPMGRWVWGLVSLAVAPLYAWFAYSAFFELFIDVPGEHYARVRMEEWSWGWTRMEFFANTPTVGSFVVLGASLLSIAAVAGTLASIARRRSLSSRNAWLVIQGGGLLAAVVATAVIVVDFLSGAGDFG